MAPDVVECCSLAKRVALRLAEGLNDGSSSTNDDVEEIWGTSVGPAAGEGAF